jgi:hypothetical protein
MRVRQRASLATVSGATSVGGAGAFFCGDSGRANTPGNARARPVPCGTSRRQGPCDVAAGRWVRGAQRQDCDLPVRQSAMRVAQRAVIGGRLRAQHCNEKVRNSFSAESMASCDLDPRVSCRWRTTVCSARLAAGAFKRVFVAWRDCGGMAFRFVETRACAVQARRVRVCVSLSGMGNGASQLRGAISVRFGHSRHRWSARPGLVSRFGDPLRCAVSRVPEMANMVPAANCKAHQAVASGHFDRMGDATTRWCSLARRQ